MERIATRGQPHALAAVEVMVRGAAPHAVLFVGPGSVGKTTLALDLAAALLCCDPDPARRPCRACRGCRMVASGNHPDLHRLFPEGPGAQIRIGRPSDPEPGTVRHLVAELALLPVEGGARLAVVEAAHRMNEDAQNALLKTLEEPPSGVTIVLCADDEERLLPTVRSRCARVRLGPVATREIERWLDEEGLADPPAAARFARLSGGRPGLALAYARAPEAGRLRGEIARGILDLVAADRGTRLTSVRALLTTAASLNAALALSRSRPQTDAAAEGAGVKRSGRRRAAAGGGGATVLPAATPATGVADGDAAPASASAATPATAEASRAATAADRREGASVLLDIWASVARDLVVLGRGERRGVTDPELLDELEAAATRIPGPALVAFLRRLGDVATQLDANANPELALDVLSLAWPRPAPVPAPAPFPAGRSTSR